MSDTHKKSTHIHDRKAMLKTKGQPLPNTLLNALHSMYI